MAWRPYENLIEGELDNTTPGTVTGWLSFFRRLQEPLLVTLALAGDFHEDIRGTKIRIKNPEPCERNYLLERDGSYVDGLSAEQRGDVGDITAGLKVNGQYPYTNYPYIEWYSEINGRVVLELDPAQVQIIASAPAPPLTDEEREATERTREHAMTAFLDGLADDAEKTHGIRPITMVIPGKKPKQA